MPQWAACAATRFPAPIGGLLGACAPGKLGTVLRMREMVHLRQDSFRAFMREADQVIAVCSWVRELLLLNGVPERKLTLCRQGLAQEMPSSSGVDQESATPGTLRVAFLGRMHPSKGVHLLIRALRETPALRVKLDLYGVRQDETDWDYERRLRELAGEDPRISFRVQQERSQVIGHLRGYDLLAVPSQVLETGPLVVLEAFAAGLPVLGSRLGGIAELVRDGEDGFLVDPGFPEQWSKQLSRLTADPTLLRKLREGVRPPRRMEEVAAEMAKLYRAGQRG